MDELRAFGHAFGAGLLLIGFAFLVLCLGLSPIASWRLRRIPGPPRLPFLGNLVQILATDITYFLHDVSMKYGPVAQVWMGARPWVLMTDAATLRKISYKMVGRPLEATSFFGMLVGEPAKVDDEGVLNARGALWKAARRAFESSIMHPERLKSHVPAVRRCIQIFLERLQPHAASGEPVDLKKAFGTMTLASVGEVAYGVDFWPRAGSEGCGSYEAELLEACRECFECLNLRNATAYLPLQLMFPALRPLWLWLAERFPDAGQRRHMAARQKVVDVSRHLMARWKTATAAGAATAGNYGEAHGHGGNDFANSHHNGYPNGDAAAKDHAASNCPTVFSEAGGGISSSSFLAVMLEERQQSAPSSSELQLLKMNDIQVVSQGLTFILAGYDTTSTTLANLAFCLASHPSVQDKLRSELLANSGWLEDVGRLAQLPYLDAAMKESQRLYTTAPIVLRDVPADIDMGNGKVVPKNAFIISNIHTIHRDPQQWPQPERFLPERFLPETKGALGPVDPNAFMPFGIGPRMCVGYKLATLTVKLTIAALLLRYRLELHPRQPLPYRLKTGLVMGPADGVWVSLTQVS